MVRGDGGFTEGMLFVIFFDQRDAIPPHPPSIRALTTLLKLHVSDSSKRTESLEQFVLEMDYTYCTVRFSFTKKIWIIRVICSVIG